MTRNNLFSSKTEFAESLRTELFVFCKKTEYFLWRWLAQLPSEVPLKTGKKGLGGNSVG